MLGFWMGGISADTSVTPTPSPTVDPGWIKKKRKPSRRIEEETDARLALERTISDIYERMHALPVEEQQEVARIVTKKAEKTIILPPIPELDFGALLQNLDAVNRLIEIRDRTIEEEEIFMLMMAIV